MKKAKRSSGHSSLSESSVEETGDIEKERKEEEGDMKVLAERLEGKEENLEEEDIEEIGRKLVNYFNF